MKKIIALLSLVFISAVANAESIRKYNWNGVEVVWLEDNRFPTYNLQVYFSDGALSDGARKGMTNAMFDLLDAGTRRFTHKDIVENLDYYGVSYGSSVYHEYSTFSVSGLVKDIDPTMRKICHLFKDSTFPKSEIRNRVKRAKSSIRNMSSNHRALADRAFREVSLRGTPFDYPVEGKLRDLSKFTQSRLRSKLDYFNNDVLKRIYISGPKSVLGIERVVAEICGWSGKAQKVRNVKYSPKKERRSPQVVLVTVPKANQAQIRMGRFLNKGEYENRPAISLAGHYLGGGFTSKLMRELRTKRGLTYSAYSTASGQKDYGRAVISTFTKNETVVDTLDVVKEILTSENVSDIKAFNRARGSLAGANPFRFEKSSSYLWQLLFMDHLGVPYSEIYNFQKKVLKTDKSEVKKISQNVFNWNNQVIMVVGNKNLAKSLRKKFRSLIVVDYKKYL